MIDQALHQVNNVGFAAVVGIILLFYLTNTLTRRLDRLEKVTQEGAKLQAAAIEKAATIQADSNEKLANAFLGLLKENQRSNVEMTSQTILLNQIATRQGIPAGPAVSFNVEHADIKNQGEGGAASG